MIVSILRIGASSRFIGGGWPPTHASSCTMIRLRRTPSRSNWTAAAAFGRFHIGGLDRPENLALGAQQDDAPSAAHRLASLPGVSLAVRRGWHGPIDSRRETDR